MLGNGAAQGADRDTQDISGRCKKFLSRARKRTGCRIDQRRLTLKELLKAKRLEISEGATFIRLDFSS